MIDPKNFREVMSLWPTGVCVITGLDGEDQPLGLVIGSFSSVSLEPPLVGFFPQKTSATWLAMRETKRFCVNILSHDQATMCSRFSFGDITKRFEGLEYSVTEGGIPKLPGCCAYIEVTAASEIDAGDHWFVLCHVDSLEAGGESSPLAFAQGRLSKLEPMPKN